MAIQQNLFRRCLVVLSLLASGNALLAQNSQTITFPQIPDHTYGDAPFAVTVTASSGLPVAISIVSGPAVLTTRSWT